MQLVRLSSVFVFVSVSLIAVGLAQHDDENEVEEILAEDPSPATRGVEQDIEDEVKGEMEEKKEKEEEEHEAPTGVRDPKPCEVCKYLALELQGRLEETGRIKEFIETGHGIMPADRKRKDYRKSELRLIEAVHNPHVCDKLLTYDIHAERKKSLRYAKGSSETRRTLKNLVHKGVKVELGIPDEMWQRDSPPNEIVHLQRLCFEQVEMHEDDIEDWYWGHQEIPLLDYLCRDRALKHKDIACLIEAHVPEEDEDEVKGEKEHKSLADSNSKTKGDPGIPSSATSAESASSTPSQTDGDSIEHTTPRDNDKPETRRPPGARKMSPLPASRSTSKEEL